MIRVLRLLHTTLLFHSIYIKLCLAQESPPANDQCENAIPITTDGALISSSTVGGSPGDSNNVELVSCGDGPLFDVETPGVWFQVDMGGIPARWRASTCAEETNFANRIALFGGDNNSCEDRACLNSGKQADPNCPYSNSSFVEWESLPDKTYYILVHDEFSDTGSGNFGLSVTNMTDPPKNNACENAVALKEGLTVEGSTVGATRDTELQCDRCIEGGPQTPGVWYTIPAKDHETEVSVAVCSPLARFDVSVFFGEVCGEFSCREATPNFDLSCDDDGLASETTWIAKAGQEYHVYVHAVDSDEDLTIGPYELRFSRAEVTDDGSENGSNGEEDTPGSGSGSGSESTTNRHWMILVFLTLLT
jgi:hypothetical protein